MIKKSFATLALTVSALTLFSQTTLPTTWDFSGATPTGWTLNGTTFYTGSGNPAPAGRFDNTGDNIVIFFSDDPGTLTYDLTGNSFAGGTFTVLESADGISYTTLHTFTAPPSSYTQFSDVTQTTSRYIKFEYTNKVSGNIGVDNVNIPLAPAGPNAEINIKQGTLTIPTGGEAIIQSAVGTPVNLDLTIENLGTVSTLLLTPGIISGTNSADFTITTMPGTVNASSTATYTVQFTPSAAGTREAVLTIGNNDSNENPYVVNLYGVGGSFATEPAVQTTNFSTTGLKSYRYRVNYTAASGVDGYIVLRKKGSAVTDVPVDGIEYTKGAPVGTSKVAYIGSANTFVPKEVWAGQDDHYAIFTYNGPGVYVNYNTNSPLTGTVTTPSVTMVDPNYYTGLDRFSPTFVTDLHNVIYPHTQIFYSDYARTIMESFYVRDTTNNMGAVTCVYSGYVDVFTPPFDFTLFSREHTNCFSWMPSNPDDATKEYSDYHHLFPTEFPNANQVRLNYPLGEVVNVTSTFIDGKFGTDAGGNTVYEPRDEQKGDAARALFYMQVCYDNTGGFQWGFDNLLSLGDEQDQDVLRAWHWQDLPDAVEMARNDYLDSLQGNRNPFIDSVNYVCAIDFRTLAHITTAPPCLITPVGVHETIAENGKMSLYPNPASTSVKVSVNLENKKANSISLFDAAGKLVYTQNINFASGLSSFDIDISKFPAGMYQLRLNGEELILNEKLLIER